VQLRYNGVIDCVKRISAEEGIHGFYRGCATNLMRTTPAAVITFTSFELILRYLQRTFPATPREENFRPEASSDQVPDLSSTGADSQNPRGAVKSLALSQKAGGV
jgi:solute carrier family 25 folate transporter 32